MRSSGAIRGTEEYWMGRMVCGLDHKFRAPKVVAPAYVDHGSCQLGLNEQALIMYWHIQDLWGPVNLVASCVAETEVILPYLTGVHQDSSWATHGCPSRYRVKDVR
jgi:hypothetical protein